MSGQCNICLSEFKDPVCIPCGHVYCSECIWDYAGAGDSDAYTASCPTCRATFPIVLPDMRGLPKKFHTFFSPSIRRVFIETTPDFDDLKERLNASESRNAVLERDNKHLMTACERFMKQSDAHATGERRVTLDLQKLKGLLTDERRKAEEMKAQLDAVQQKYDKLKLAHREQDRCVTALLEL
ncbi:hypothetical protein CPB85DRAFT_370618 [Mucidula mucida]|nr:hypothetical protein CPB85DRAFT_370618 [Mucidula mucida]